jgi:hypothetical protein
MVSDNDCYYPWTRTRCYVLTCDDLLSYENFFLGCNLTASYKLLMCWENCGVLIANDDQNKISLIASLEGYSGAFSFCGTRKTFLPIQNT